MLVKLAELGVPVLEEEVLAFVGSSPSVGRPHIADALVAAGRIKDRKEAFDRYLADGGPAHVARYAIDIGHGVDLVHGAGAVAVIAHPWGRGREQLLPPPVLAELVAEHGLDGIEVDHQDHAPPPGPGCGGSPSGSGCWRPVRATTTAPARWTTTRGEHDRPGDVRQGRLARHDDPACR